MMKTFLPFKQNLLILTVLLLLSAASQAQSGCQGPGPCNIYELKFNNHSYVSGSGNNGAGSLNSVYRFSDVKTNVDALVKINARSSSSVTLSEIDLESSGFDNAFQPQIKYGNGSVNSSQTWWMEFLVSFVHKNTNNPTTINTFNITALDIDGDGDNLREFNSFYNPVSYKLELNTQISVTNFILNLLNAGKTFTGSITDYAGIDTNQTRVMTTLTYNDVNSIRFRVGSTTTGSSTKTERMSAIWFKSFNYSAPITSLPVKLVSFNAILNNNQVDLKWTTASEINVSHFSIEKSLDGVNYSQTGLVFAYGNTADIKNYSFTDRNLNTQSGVIYYRLRSVDIDQKSELSEVRVIRIGRTSEQSLAIAAYPNPANNNLNITIPNKWQGKKVSYEIFNNHGRMIIKEEPNSSSQTETLNVSSLAPGIYLVKATCEGETATQKIIKR